MKFPKYRKRTYFFALIIWNVFWFPLLRGCNRGYRWDKERLIEERKEGGVGMILLPGYSFIKNVATLERMSNGDVKVHEVQTERGMMLFMVPFWEMKRSSVILERANHSQ